MQEAWIKVVGLPLHLWTTEILKKLGDACGGFVAVDEVIEMKKEVKWARLLIKSSGKARPSVVNILEGPRSYELQIWWEIPPWATGVYPVSSRFVGKNPKEEDEEGARAAERVGCPCLSCNDAGQKAQGCGTKKEKGSGLLGSDVVNPVSGALMRRRGGAYVGGLGDGKYKQAGLSAGANFEVIGPSPYRSKSPVDQRDGVHKTAGGADRLGGFFGPVSTGRRGGAYVEGLGDGKYKQSGLFAGANFEVIRPSPDRNRSPVEQRDGVHKTVVGADRLGGFFGLGSTGPKQASPQKCLKALKSGNRGKRGLDNDLIVARSGPKGVTSCPKEEKMLEDGGSHLGAVCSLESLVDPAWICAWGPLLNVQEGRLGLGETSGFESCWEEGLGAVSPDCPSMGISYQDHGEEGCLVARSFALVEVVSECPDEDDPEALCILVKGSRFDTVLSVDFLLPFSLFLAGPYFPRTLQAWGISMSMRSWGKWNR